MRGMSAARNCLLAFLLIIAGGDAMAGKSRKSAERAPVAVESTETGNLSNRHREELIGKIGAIRDHLRRSSDTNATQPLAFAGELEKEVRTKKYGLVFEEHKERISARESCATNNNRRKVRK